MTQLVLLIGLPGAGKTTFYRTHFPAHVHASKDLWPSARRPENRLRRVVNEALGEGRSVVVDNVNAGHEQRAPLFEIAREHGADVVGYYFDVDPQTALERNERREGRARVPPVAVFDAARRLELPTYEEGFHRLFAVWTLDRWRVEQVPPPVARTPVED